MQFERTVLAVILMTIASPQLTACGDASDGASLDAAREQANDTVTTANTYEGNRVEERITVPDWLPADIYLPDDYQATQAVDIAAPNYTLRGISSLSQAELLEAYGRQLAESGYNVTTPDQIDAEEPVIVFGGKGLSSGAVRIRDDGDRREIQMSFTRRSAG